MNNNKTILLTGKSSFKYWNNRHTQSVFQKKSEQKWPMPLRDKNIYNEWFDIIWANLKKNINENK